MKKLHLIMPMGGGGTRFGIVGYESPKPLIDLNGLPFFVHAARSITDVIDVASITFVVLRDHVNRFSIDKKIKEYYKDAEIIIIEEVLKGAVLTCLEGVKNLPKDEPILFNDCDHSFVCNDFENFCKESRFDEIDGGIMTFESDSDAFSYVAFGDDGYINKTVEKVVISNDAVCGAYYFKNRQVFEEASEKYLKECSYKEFFVSGVYNVMADKGAKIKAFRTDEQISFGTPAEYEQAKKIYEERCK